jgi:predicted kinase
MVIIVFGLPGSGKSTLAQALAAYLRGPCLSSDRIRKTLIRDIEYTPEEKSAVYHQMLEQAAGIVTSQNDDVVLDGTFHLAETRRRFKETLPGDTPLYWIEVRAKESLIHERLAIPRQDSDADFVVYQQIRTEWEPEEEDHLILWSENDNLGQLLQTALQYLNVVYEASHP